MGTDLGEPGVVAEELDLVPEGPDGLEARVGEIPVVHPEGARDHEDDAVPPRLRGLVPDGFRDVDEVPDAVGVDPDPEVVRRIEDFLDPEGAHRLAYDVGMRDFLAARGELLLGGSGRDEDGHLARLGSGQEGQLDALSCPASCRP
jgi:hypothetical protein